MEWHDRGIVLSGRPHGETGVIVQLMTAEHGRHAGMVRGHRRAAHLQPGTGVDAVWRARLAEHLGTFTLEAQDAGPAAYLGDPLKLAALASACALVETALPERQAYPAVHAGLEALIEALAGPYWDAVYVRWEIGLLGALGFGLDLERCAATGANDDLVYVSPRSGRAVSASAGEPYRDRLLSLPGFLVGRGDAPPEDVHAGLGMTGHFLDRLLFGQSHQPVPAARTRYVEAYRRFAARSGRLPES
ncbi:MAG: DNA repair protein RecO [Azospirillaceae bacterium]